MDIHFDPISSVFLLSFSACFSPSTIFSHIFHQLYLCTEFCFPRLFSFPLLLSCIFSQMYIQHVRASFQSSFTFYIFLNCLSTQQIYFPFSLFHLPDSLPPPSTSILLSLSTLSLTSTLPSVCNLYRKHYLHSTHH